MFCVVVIFQVFPPPPPCSPSLRHVDHPRHVDPAHRAGVQEDHQAAAGRVSLHVRICQLCPGGHHVDDVSFQINPISMLMIIQISQGLILRQEGKIQESLEQFQVGSGKSRNFFKIFVFALSHSR